MTKELIRMKNPYHHFLPDECVEQKFVNPQWEAWEEAHKAGIKEVTENIYKIIVDSDYDMASVIRCLDGYQALLKAGGGK